MRIRYKITFWVAGAGLLTSLLFSLVSFFEMREQPIKQLDSELDAMSEALSGFMAGGSKQPDAITEPLRAILGDRYRYKVFDGGGRLICQSDSASLGNVIPDAVKPARYDIKSNPGENAGSSQAALDEPSFFRVRAARIQIGGEPCFILIAKSMDELEHELDELIMTLVFGLIGSTVFLMFLSHLVAGRILRPIRLINRLSREIGGNTLQKRIPLADSRDEIYELSSGLNNMFDRLQNSFVKQQAFFANASHELKSPTAMLRLFLEEAAQRQDLPESFRVQLTGQEKTVHRMDRLIRTLLEISVLELKDSLELEEFDLGFLIQDLLGEFSALTSEKKIRVELNAPVKIPFRGDKEKIRRMLINILDNAIRYNRDDGEMILAVSETSNEIHVSLFNTGPGIPESDLEKVFEQFYRVEKSRSVKYGGSGLGLAIVKEIVRLHKGRVAMESRPGAWARIVIALPKHLT